MRPDLTIRQKEVLDYIKSQLRARGFPPSVREIGLATGLSSSSTVHMHLTQLEEKGYIKRDPSKPRAIEILDENLRMPEIVTLAVVGQVAAGTPILAEENTDGFFSVSADFLGSGSHFILKVKGESMIEAGIFDGDMVIVRSQEDARNGEIVVAMMDEEATVKRYYRTPEYIELRPENPSFQPIRSKDVSVIGIVTGLIRRM